MLKNINEYTHTSVLFEESIKNLGIKKDGIYVDLTLGAGGHALGILNQLSNKGILFGFDKDILAINHCKNKFSKHSTSKNIFLHHNDFINFKKILEEKNIFEVDGIIADLGVSSPQINSSQRGFSYKKDGKLDMRMNKNDSLSAYDVVNFYDYDKLFNIFQKYGVLKYKKRIVDHIIKNRPIETTLKLVEIIKNALPSYFVRKKNPSKIIFQAIRIEVNNEIENLHKMLAIAIQCLKINGTLLIISFHSLEDKIIKNFFKNLASDQTGKLPIKNYKLKWFTKKIKISKQEIKNNKRSRSSILRILRRNY